MTLQTIASDIEGFAAEELARFGLKVVASPSEDPMGEDDAIEFHDGQGRTHAVSIQVSSLSPSWARSSMSIRHTELKPIAGSRFSFAEMGWEHREFRSNSRVGRIEEVFSAITAHNQFLPVDDLENGIVTDFRMESVIPKLLEHFDGEVRLSRSGADTDVDTIEIVGRDDKVVASVVFTGQSEIRLTCTAPDGDDRVLHYGWLTAFQDAVDGDLGATPALPNTGGPRI